MIMVISFIFFLLLIAGMSIGVILANKPIKGSCGGLSNIGITGDCMICGRSATVPQSSASQPTEAQATAPLPDDLFYNAAQDTVSLNSQRSHPL